MKNHGVSWKEGMFLLPQHFQQQELYYLEQSGLSSYIDHPYHYGFRALEIELSAFESWQLRLGRISGRCKNGLQFDLEQGEAPQIDLKTAEDGQVEARLRRGEPVSVYLGISKIRPNEKNVTIDGGMARYREFEQDLFDQRSGGKPKPIVLKKLNVCVAFSDERNAEFDFLSIGKLELTNSRHGPIPRFVQSCFPPLTVSRGSFLAEQFFQEQEDKLTSYLLLLKQNIVAEEISVGSISDPQHGDKVHRFIVLSELRAWMTCHNRSPGIHPFAFFQYLAQLLGRLSILNAADDLLPQYPAYDHDDLGKSFAEIWELVRAHYRALDSTILQLPFKLEEFETEGESKIIAKVNGLAEDHFESDLWAMYLGIYYSHMTRSQTELFFKKYLWDQKFFYWKMGDENHINKYFNRRIEGVTFTNAKKIKPRLGRKSGWVYFDINDNEYWDSVKESLTLCLRMDENNFYAKQSDIGSDTFSLTIDDGGKKTYRIKMAIWLVNLKNVESFHKLADEND
jgi:type VI secretion system protein ImpJ